MGIRTSFNSIGGSSSNWKVLTHPGIISGRDVYLFPSNTHKLLILSMYGQLLKTDLETISVLNGDNTFFSFDEVYYNNDKNQLLLITTDYTNSITRSYISTDTNLTTYSAGSLPADPYRKYAETDTKIIYGNGYYVIGGSYYPNTTENPNMTSQPAIFYSTNGNSWTRVLLNTSVVNRTLGGVDQVGYGNSKFIAFGDYFTNSNDYSCKAVASSTPKTWTKSSWTDSGHVRVPIIYCNGYFYHYSWNSNFIRSNDGSTWETLTKPSGFDAEFYNFNVIYHNNLYYLFGRNYFGTTSDFKTYNRYKLPYSGYNSNQASIVIMDNKIVIGNKGCLYISKISELEKEV